MMPSHFQNKNLVQLDLFIELIEPLADEQRIEKLWEDQRERWERGEQVPAEEYARRFDRPLGDSALCDLIYGEFMLQNEVGESPTADQYSARFPDLDELLRRQLRVEQAFDTQPLGATQPSQPKVESGREPPTLETLPNEIGKYRVISLLGSGGHADVYRAVHPTLEQEVVIKRSRRHLASGSRELEQWITEGRLMAELDHANLVRVLDCDVDGQRPFLAMQYVVGRNLDQFAANRRLDADLAAGIVAKIARAVQYAHGRGVLHLDIKPANVVIDEADEPRLIDFGLGRFNDAWRIGPLEENPGLAGTMQYMAPEQARSESSLIGAHSDVFALGGLLFFLLTGAPPYEGRPLSELLSLVKAGQWRQATLDSCEEPEALKQ
ncbi:MAG: serine/threonine protein kinase, partial [Planctomycetales bacterium]|nr:serine/threonine protein kinase [Planctomycetales bacterium]